MDTRNADEIAYRRRAIRLTLKGKRPSEILQQVPRTRQWLHKWQGRFEHGGWAGLASHDRRPHHSPHAYHRAARAVIVQVRRPAWRAAVWGWSVRGPCSRRSAAVVCCAPSRRSGHSIDG